MNTSHKNYIRISSPKITSQQNLINAGFNPKIVRILYSKMKQSRRPMAHYSKTTGLLLKRYKKL